MPKSPIWRRPAVLACCIIAVSTLARFWFVATNQLDLVQDEAQYWDWSRYPQWSYYSKGPLIAYLIGFWVKIFGPTELGVRFGAMLCSLLSQVILYLGLARLMKRPVLGVWTLLVANTTPLFIASSALMTTDAPLVTCWLAALFCLYWAGEAKKPALPLALLALALALGMLAKYMMLAFVGTAGLYGLGLIREKRVRPRFLLALGLALVLGLALGTAPILAWNMQNNFAGFRHVAALAGVANANPMPLLTLVHLPEYLGSQIALLTPWWFVFLFLGAWAAWKTIRTKPAPGAALEEAAERRQAWLFSAGFWPVWLFFLAWSFHKQIYPNWPGVSYVSGMILAASAFGGYFAKAREKDAGRGWLPWLWPAAGGVVLTAMVLANLLTNLAHLPENLDPMMRLKGWGDLGQQAEMYRETEFADSSRVFFFSDEYDITAALAFYIPGQPRTYCALHDRRLCQYDFWPGPQDKLGWDAVYVRKRFKDMDPPLAAMFERVEFRHFQSTHQGKNAQKFTLALCYGFKGPWPALHGDLY